VSNPAPGHYRAVQGTVHDRTGRTDGSLCTVSFVVTLGFSSRRVSYVLEVRSPFAWAIWPRREVTLEDRQASPAAGWTGNQFDRTTPGVRF
jgi:hypothetical protein